MDIKMFEGKVEYVKVFNRMLNDKERKEEMQKAWDELNKKTVNIEPNQK